MLTFDQLREALPRWSYHPGWSYRLYEHRYEGTWVAITAEVVDAYHPGTTVTICVRSAVPPIPTVDYWFEWLLWRSMRIDSHEGREFGRVDGVALHDPHAVGANDDSPV